LDGIRGIAILSVLIWHYFPCLVQVHPQPRSLLAYSLKAVSFTWSGVDLFFVLSGFLIGGILMDNKESLNYFKVFYFRRICRIFPLYYAWLIIFIIALLIFPMLASTPRSNWLFGQPLPLWSYVTYTQNILMAGAGIFGANFLGITWSLAIEEQFYLLLPMVIRFLSPRRLLPILIALITATPFIRLAFFNYHPSAGLSAYVLLPCRLDALLLGVLCACLMREEKAHKFIASHTVILYIGFTILLLGVILLLRTGQSLGTFSMSFWGYSLLALFYSCLLLIAITEKRGVISYISRNILLRKLGLLAYGVYILHQGVSGLCHALLRNQTPQINTPADILVTLFALAVTISIAYASWMLFESRFVILGHTIKYQ
jgi:peptidoglycan/LPS O-acetylase OafA/YrhL